MQRLRECHQVDIDRIQDQLDGHQNNDNVTPGQHAHRPDKQESGAQGDVMRCGYRVHSQIRFFAITTETTTATTSRMEAISNGSRYSLNNTSASCSEFAGGGATGIKPGCAILK